MAFASMYNNPEDGVALMVHGDDYLCVGADVGVSKCKTNTKP